MKYLLDSNVVIAAAVARSDLLRERLAACDEGDLVMSSIVYAEVVFGSRRGLPPRLDALHRLIEEVPLIDFDAAAARAYAELAFERASFDRLIAAHALSRGLILVTDNMKHFSRIPDLRAENWNIR